MTAIIIVDDQNSIREFLKINLSTEADIEVVGMADNGQAAIVQVEEHQPDLVLMDIEMPGEIDGIDATEAIVRRFPNTKVLLFTSQDDKQQLNRALKVGARGYVLKNTSVKDIGNIIRLTEKGFFQIGPIFGNWDGSGVNNHQSEVTATHTEYIPHKVSAIVRQNSDYAYENEVANSPGMNHVISDLTSGIFQLQETIKSQEDTIVNLTNQYSQVQHEIKTKLRNDKSFFNGYGGNIYNSRVSPKALSQRRQHFLFISSFFLGVFTVIILIFVITTLGSVL
ncbi:response regulator transcription factor [Waterburya agarophytonicola K14]|uniref:Response regulator transcription factor n=1 Tax=Waterburya agarophytonicola KI4 TaxID=2874699 RepID=A0A964FDM3_9CYAN|nr:response regulator transcription factor [Waterburya agarophytonicola]MCC0175750.1 response regulator transcription factor [Waterburya agarophytonicola KI4]